MKYKIVKGWALFDQLSFQARRMIRCNRQARALVEELGGQRYMQSGALAAGGLLAIEFETQPEGWKRVSGDNGYYPKSNKKNKDILARIEALPVIRKEELNAILGYKNQIIGNRYSTCIGIVFGEDVMLISTLEEADYTPLEGMEEITVSEFNRLKKIIHEAREKEVAE